MILIVDDNQDNLFSLRTLLDLHYFKVDTASSGEEALKKVLTRHYALIILDVQMPDMDGFEVAEAISGYSKLKDIPIIFLSAVNTHKRFITKGYTSGGIDYVTKPFDPDILLLKIKTFYKLSEQTRQLNALEKSLRAEIELRKEAENVLERKVEERTRELRKSNQRLEENNKELQQFAFIASHDLQEPLRKIQTFSSIALEKYMGEKDKLRTYLDKISSSATRLRSLVTDLLDYSRIYADERFVNVDLDDLVHQVIADVEIQVNDIPCSIEVQGLGQAEVVPSQIRQVFQNLISNSIKFARQGIPCSIRIRGECVGARAIDAPAQADGHFIRITIIDNGIGFSNKFSERIFEIFQRLNGRDVYKGTGIGLAIVKRVIEAHDGLISACGQENEGAVFTIVLPARHEPAFE